MSDTPENLVRRTAWPQSASRAVGTPIQPSVVYASLNPDQLDAQYDARIKGYTYAREGHPNAEVFPSIEVINRLHPPAGQSAHYPIPIDVTQDEETRGTRRKKAIRQWELSFGPASPGNLNSKSDGINWKFGYLWGIDDRIDLKFSWEMLTSTDEDDVNFTDIYLGMNYFFSDANHAPYVTADFGYGGATAHDPNNSSLFGSDDDATGFAFGFGVGMKFLRVSTVNVGLQLRHAMMFSETEHTKKKPYVTSLMLSAYF